MKHIISVILLCLYVISAEAKIKHKKHKSVKSHKLTTQVKHKSRTIKIVKENKSIAEIKSIPEDAVEEIRIDITDDTQPVVKQVCISGNCKNIKIHTKFNGTTVPKKK